jgi:hypothetical protein
VDVLGDRLARRHGVAALEKLDAQNLHARSQFLMASHEAHVLVLAGLDAYAAVVPPHGLPPPPEADWMTRLDTLGRDELAALAVGALDAMLAADADEGGHIAALYGVFPAAARTYAALATEDALRLLLAVLLGTDIALDTTFGRARTWLMAGFPPAARAGAVAFGPAVAAAELDTHVCMNAVAMLDAAVPVGRDGVPMRTAHARQAVAAFQRLWVRTYHEVLGVAQLAHGHEGVVALAAAGRVDANEDGFD